VWLCEITLLDAVAPANICSLFFVRYNTSQYLLVHTLFTGLSCIWIENSAGVADVEQNFLKCCLHSSWIFITVENRISRPLRYIYMFKKIGGPGSLNFWSPKPPRSQRECKSASGENVCQMDNFRHKYNNNNNCTTKNEQPSVSLPCPSYIFGLTTATFRGARWSSG
jgi:hypothetical protein